MFFSKYVMLNYENDQLLFSKPIIPLPLNPKGAERTVGETLSSLKRATASLDSILR